MKLKQSIAVLLAVVLAVAAFSMAASADGTVTVGGASYKVVSPKSVAITGDGVSPSYRGNGSVEVLIDGDIARSVTNHDNKGIMLIINDEVGAKATTPVEQDVDNIPTAYIEMDFGSEVSFDTAYMAIFWQQAGIYEPADNKVIIETSSDGKVWVPAGTDGVFYFSMPKCPDWEEGLPNSDQGYPYVGEVAVPLGETVKARYVRYAYTFPVLEEGSHWTFYTNVAEFIGFTEVGVATFQSGRKPKKLSAKDVVSRPEVEGGWIAEDGEEVTVMTFADEKGELAYTANVYDRTDYITNGSDAEVLDTVQGSYFIEGSTVVVITGSSYDEYKASFDGDGNLVLDLDGEETVCYTAKNYAAANPGAADPSGEESGDESAEESVEASVEASSEEPSAASSEGSVEESSAASSTGSTSVSSSGEEVADEGGFPMTAIVGIVAGVVVIAAAVVAVILRRKKK